jgi:hypothetical protein
MNRWDHRRLSNLESLGQDQAGIAHILHRSPSLVFEEEGEMAIPRVSLRAPAKRLSMTLYFPLNISFSRSQVYGGGFSPQGMNLSK